MSSSQGAAKGSKDIKSDPRRRRGSCLMMLLGVALLIGAVLLYFYYKSNLPQIRTRQGDITNIDRNPSNTGAGSTRPTPSPTASP